MKKAFTRTISIALATITLSIQCITPFPPSIFTVSPLTVSTIAAQASNKTFGDFTYTESDGNVTITGYTGTSPEVSICIIWLVD